MRTLVASWAIVLVASCSGSNRGDVSATDGGNQDGTSASCGTSDNICCNGTACNVGLVCTAGTCALQGEGGSGSNADATASSDGNGASDSSGSSDAQGADATTGDASATADGGLDASIDAGGAPCESLNIPTGGGAVVNGSAAVLLSTGDYCYETWARLDGSKQSPAYLAACTSGSDCNAILSIRNDLGQVVFGVQANGQPLLKVYAAIGGAVTPDDGQWHHVAGCRAISGGTVSATLFWDGQLVATASGSTSSIGVPTDLRLGSSAYSTTDGLGGYLDEVRVSNTLRYTGAFTPQTRFVNDAWTAILLHFDSRTGATFVDSSSNAFTGSLLGAAAAAPICPGAATAMCTSFTYSAWGDCQPDDTQTRTVSSSSPAGCGGGSPVLSQSCTYTFSVSCYGPTPSITAACGVPDPYTYSIMNGVAYLNIDTQMVSVACTIDPTSNTAQCPLNAIWYGAPNRTWTFTYDPVSSIVTVEMFNPANNGACYWNEPCTIPDGGADGG